MATPTSDTDPFDPDAPGSGGLFGLPHTPDSAAVVVLPVGFDGTTTYHRGTAEAPRAILAASHQVDLCDPETGQPWRDGIALEAPPHWLEQANLEARGAADQARTHAPGSPEHTRAVEKVDAVADRIRAHVEAFTAVQLGEGRIPAVLGGEHSVPLGALSAASSAFPGLGVLHIDAHADLRVAYEGFRNSHASIFDNALRLTSIAKVVQFGVRDFGVAEHERFTSDPRLYTWTEQAILNRLNHGFRFFEVAQDAIRHLPDEVWISFDIDGLDPSLCPGTGTPVPGGMTWRETRTLLEVLGSSGRRIVGFDLCEVGPGDWDANVGARLLYKLAGWAIATNRRPSAGPG